MNVYKFITNNADAVVLTFAFRQSLLPHINSSYKLINYFLIFSFFYFRYQYGYCQL